MSITRRPWFWVAHSIFFLICFTYTWKNFEGAFPFVDIKVKMSRPEAIRDAASLATRHGWSPPAGRREAVSFDTDSSTTNFIELEAGGAKALKQVLDAGIYMPYTWRVRHFAEGVPQETEVRFTPEGKAYGFRERLAEADPGAALKIEAARALAEKSAASDWGIDLGAYELAEKSSETRKSGRVDHSLVYERKGVQIGEGRYRLKLAVSGDRFTELRHFIKVPDAFYRRYASMRSDNSTIAELAGAAISLIYGLGLCGFGLFYLARRRWVLWRAPVAVAGVIAVLHFVEQLNRFPLEWMGYDTAIEASAFIFRQVTGSLVGAIFDFLLVAISLIAAEAMSRRAFPNQPQVSKMFSFGPEGGAASRQTLGRVVGAYLFVGFHFAWVTWMYRTGSQRLGWWNPSELLFHPDALATYLPWLTSVASSLHAGVWEECLFRALPLAAAAILGSRYGKRGTWIACAFILQAVIFGAAHASYPTQPSYARVVELLVPSAVFGGAYLLFGLLPGIIIHFTYDVVLFAMPVFLSEGPSARVSQLLIILLSLLPLWIVLLARLKAGRWHELPAALYNGAWTPSLPQASPVASQEAAPARIPLSKGQSRALLVTGVLGLGLWTVLSALQLDDAPGLKQSRSEVIAQARRALEIQGVKLGPEWRPLVAVSGAPGEEEDFVWRVSGEDSYRALLGRYLEPPLWRVRFAKFEGDVAERAEEHQVFILGSGEIFRIRHEIPEGRPGKVLDERQARGIALAVVEKQFALSASQISEVASNQTQLPTRRDWLFTWRDPSAPLKQGEARVAVKIAGDEAVGYRRFVHVPEDWLRMERSRKTVMSVARMLGGAVFSILMILLAFDAFRDLTRGHFDRKVFAGVLVGGTLASIILRVNEFVMAAAFFNTAQPWSSQVFRVIVSGGLTALAGTVMLAVFLGRVHAPDVQRQTAPPPDRHRTLWAGYAAGAWLAAFAAAASWLGKAEHPVWPSFGPAAAQVPWLEALQPLVAYTGGAAFLMLLYPWITSHCATWSRKLGVYALIGLAVGSFMAESTLLELLGAGLATGLAFFLVGELVMRTSVAILIPLSATVMILRAVRVASANPYSGSVIYGLLLAGGVALVSWVWFTRGFGAVKTPMENRTSG